jgi:hypothetical protein
MDPYGGDFRDHGVVVGNLSFGWNTGTSEKYEMRFDNKWGQICGENGCSPDPSNPSSHNKTIELNVRETSPGLIATLPPIPANLLYGLATVVGVGLVTSGIVILREMRKRKHFVATRT